MILARFYKLDATFPEPKYKGRTPVFFVMEDRPPNNPYERQGTK